MNSEALVAAVVALLKAIPWWPALVAFLAWKFGGTILAAIQQGGLEGKATIPGVLELQLRRKSLEAKALELQKEQPYQLPKGVSPAGAENVVEGTKFVLRSPEGALRLEIGVANSAPWLPFIRFFDEHGNNRIVLGMGENGAGLYMQRPGDPLSPTAALVIGADGSRLALPGRDQDVTYLSESGITIMGSDGSPKAYLGTVTDLPGKPAAILLEGVNNEEPLILQASPKKT